MKKLMKGMKICIGLLIIVIMIGNPIASLATNLASTTDTLNTEYPCHTECKLHHNHQTEVCEIEYYGKLLDWSTIPFAWEYNYDNAQACWNYGMPYNGATYTTPKDTFDIDVRHKVALYCDGEYLYLDVIQATVNGSTGMGSDLEFKVDGEIIKFHLALDSGEIVDSSTPKGTYELTLTHENNTPSGTEVSGYESYLYVNETHHNTEYEVKIPLTALKYQNPNVDLDNINEISVFSHNFMYRPLVTAGISTYPYLLALLCVVGVAITLYKKTSKRKG